MHMDIWAENNEKVYYRKGKGIIILLKGKKYEVLDLSNLSLRKINFLLFSHTWEMCKGYNTMSFYGWQLGLN